MAQYTIVTTPEQEVGLEYSFNIRVDKALTKEQFLMDRINHVIFDPMVLAQHDAVTVALDRSIQTIPANYGPKAALEIQAVIVANGGTLIPVGPIGLPPIATLPPIP